MKYDHNFELLVLLNIKWARSGAPRCVEEKSILAILIVGGLRETHRCAVAQEYLPLVAFLGMPALTVWASIV